MAQDLTIKVPSIKQTNTPSFKQSAIAGIKKYKKNYSAIVTAASTALGVPEMVIYGFMVIENMTATPTTVSGSGAIGFMQIIPRWGYGSIWEQRINLNAEFVKILKKHAPKVYNGAALRNYNDATAIAETKKALVIPEFNIWLGTLIIAQYLNASLKKYNAIRLDHVIVRYNSGTSNFKKFIENKGIGGKDTTAIYNAIPQVETKSYIVKLLGIDGSMDIQVKKLA